MVRIKYNEEFILPCCLEFELTKQHIIFKYENFETLLRNNELTRLNLIGALQKCYNYILYKKYL
jgi:hypothetical protein